MAPSNSEKNPYADLFYPPYRWRLYQALEQAHPNLANLYKGVLQSYGQRDNPLRFASASLGVREIMGQLAHYKGLPQSGGTERLGDKVRKLEAEWDKVFIRSGCRSTEGWSGEIDGILKSFIAIVEGFFDWYKTERPNFRHKSTVMLRHLDYSSIPLPPDLEQRRVKSWIDLLDYFNSTVHLSGNTDNFESRLSAVERFLLDQLNPKTFDDQVEIDTIIMDGERHDQS